MQLRCCPLFCGPPRTKGLHSNSTPLWALKKAGVMQPVLILSMLLGPPEPKRKQGLHGNFAYLWAWRRQG